MALADPNDYNKFNKDAIHGFTLYMTNGHEDFLTQYPKLTLSGNVIPIADVQSQRQLYPGKPYTACRGAGGHTIATHEGPRSKFNHIDIFKSFHKFCNKIIKKTLIVMRFLPVNQIKKVYTIWILA